MFPTYEERIIQKMRKNSFILTMGYGELQQMRTEAMYEFLTLALRSVNDAGILYSEKEIGLLQQTCNDLYAEWCNVYEQTKPWGRVHCDIVFDLARLTVLVEEICVILKAICNDQCYLSSVVLNKDLGKP